MRFKDGQVYRLNNGTAARVDGRRGPDDLFGCCTYGVDRRWNRYGESLCGDAEFNLIPLALTRNEREHLVWLEPAAS